MMLIHLVSSSILLALLRIASDPTTSAAWPGAAGPDGNWQVRGVPAPPDSWSVTRGEHIAWRTPLPEGGQSGIAIGGGRVFLTTLAPYRPEPGAPSDDAAKMSKDVVGFALDEKTGAILWSRVLRGSVPSPNLYAYSDSSTPTPLTDGEHVWFYNASGDVACYTHDGTLVWEHAFTPWSEADGFPFNKQYEPIAYGDWILNVEPLDPSDPRRKDGSKQGWNYLRALDKKTGATVWIAEDGTTTYDTPVFGFTDQGVPAILHGRGGWHGVPEAPVGIGLTSLRAKDAGKTLWRWIAGTDANGEALVQPGTLGAPTWQALYVQHWDARHAYWFELNPIESHLVFDSRNGKLEKVQSLVHGVDLRRFDRQKGRYEYLPNVNLRDLVDPAPRMAFDAKNDVIVVHPAWHSNIVVAGYHYFLCSTAHGRNAAPNATRPGKNGKAGPSHCLGRVAIETGKVEYLELPVSVVREIGKPDRFLYGEAQRTATLNSRGIDPVKEDRSRTDGFEIPAFWGSPTAVNDHIYFTTTLGLTYVIDGAAKVLDEHALLSVSDLGPVGDTWSLNSISYANGRLFHRSLREVLCIGP